MVSPQKSTPMQTNQSPETKLKPIAMLVAPFWEGEGTPAVVLASPEPLLVESKLGGEEAGAEALD